jgi:hypothetical protein
MTLLPDTAAYSTSMNILTSQEEENPARIKEILQQIKFGDDLSEDEGKELEQLVADNADIFTLVLKEVVPIPGATLNLNVPENAVFNL